MNRFPFLIPILFSIAALILLFFAVILVGFVPFTTFNYWRGGPDIVRQFRQSPITGEVSPVALDHMLTDRSTAVFLDMFTDAASYARVASKASHAFFR